MCICYSHSDLWTDKQAVKFVFYAIIINILNVDKINMLNNIQLLYNKLVTEI